MIFLIQWLEKRRSFNIFLVALYFIAVVLPHKRFGTWLNQSILGKGGVSRDQYNDYVAIVATLTLLAVIVLIFNSLRQNVQLKKITFYLLASTALSVLMIKTLFVINIEIVHFPQYACFAILIFPLVKRYQSALIWTTIAGAVDEAYQYFYLAPNETGYYDFNDVITNLIGASFGLIILRASKVPNPPSPSFFKRSEVQILIASVLTISVLFLFNILGIHEADGAMYPIVKKEINSFWSTVHPQVTYHVVRPLEGVILTILLFLFYWKLGGE